MVSGQRATDEPFYFAELYKSQPECRRKRPSHPECVIAGRTKKRKIGRHIISSAALLSAAVEHGQGRANPLLLPHSTQQWTPSKMVPGDSQWIGDSGSWPDDCLYQNFEQLCLRRSNPVRRPVMKQSSLPGLASINTPVEQVKHFITRNTRSASAPLPDSSAQEYQAIANQAYLKTQLICALRMRQQGQPGESNLRLRKFVAWNSWTRRPMTSTILRSPRLQPITVSLPTLTIPAHSASPSPLEETDSLSPPENDLSGDGEDGYTSEDSEEDEDLDDIILDELLQDEEFMQSALNYSAYNVDSSTALVIDEPTSIEAEVDYIDPSLPIEGPDVKIQVASHPHRPVLRHAFTVPLSKKSSAIHINSPALEKLATLHTRSSGTRKKALAPLIC